MAADSRPSPEHDERLSPGTRIQDLVVEQWVRAVPDGHHYRVVHPATGRGATLHEYLPRGWAQRQADGVRALPGHGQDFQAGMRRFLMKARQLKALEHPALPVVLEAWSSHGTAYALLAPLPAQTLSEVVAAQGGRLRLVQAWPWMCACFELAEWLHRQGKIHGAWDPDAIWVQEDQRLVMAAPEVDGGVRLASPWVALEQTAQAPSGIKCGPWTDVFGIAAIAAFMLTGQSPVTARRLPLAAWMPPVAPGGARKPAGEPPPRALLAAIRVSLLPNPRQRPQDIAQLKAMMGLGPQLPILQDRETSGPEVVDSIFGGDTVPMHDLPDTQVPQPARVAAAAAAAIEVRPPGTTPTPASVAVVPAAAVPLSEAETEPIPLMAEPVVVPAASAAPAAAIVARRRSSPSAYVLAGLGLVAVLVAWLAVRPERAPEAVAQQAPAAAATRSLDGLLQAAPPAAGPAAAAPTAASGAGVASTSPTAAAAGAGPATLPAAVDAAGPGGDAAARAGVAPPPATTGAPAVAPAGRAVAAADTGASPPAPSSGAERKAADGVPSRDDAVRSDPPPAGGGAADARRAPPQATAARRLNRCSQALLEQSLGGAGGAANPKDCR